MRRAPRITASRSAAIALVAALAGSASDARAQCTSGASSCVSCHESDRALAVLGDGSPWHTAHGYADLCSACHAGDPQAATKDGAHAGLRDPLGDPAASCGGCHAADAAARASTYAQALARVPSHVGASGLRTDETTPSVSTRAPTRRSVDRVLAAAAALLAVLLAWLFTIRGDRRKHGGLREWTRARTWSAYVAGATFGVVVAVSEALLGRPIAASGAFDRLAAYPGKALFPSNAYYSYVMRPGITWPVWLMLGAMLGAFASARLAGVARWRWLPEEGWSERFGRSRALRLGVAFFGAILVQLGADIAGGCTSGLAISGGALLSPGAFLFMAGMFAGGIPAAWVASTIAKRRRSS